MIDLTPLDVRKKRGDFRKMLRGYDPDEVDGFLEVVAERLEELVKENLTLRERTDRLQEQVAQQEEREHAVREALVTAQELRSDMRVQARREAELLRREAEEQIERILQEAERRLEERRDALEKVERLRLRFLRSFRSLLEREMDAVEVEEGRKPLEDTPLEIDFTVGDLESRIAAPDSPPPPAAGDGEGDEDGDPEARILRSSAGPDAETATERPPDGGEPTSIPEPGEVGPDAEVEARSASSESGDQSLWLSSILKDGDAEEGEADEAW